MHNGFFVKFIVINYCAHAENLPLNKGLRMSYTPQKIMMMNCFCGMVDRRKAFSLISRWDHCQRSSPLRIFDTPRAGFHPVQNLSSGLVE